MTIDRNFKENNEPFFSLHSTGPFWFIIMFATIIIAISSVLQGDHDGRKQQSSIRSNSGNQTVDSTGHNVGR